MNKVLTSDQFRTLDQATISSEPINSIDLMERAADKCFNWIKNRITNELKVHVVCGTGNNGGDGLAISRMLIDEGYDIELWIVDLGNEPSADFQINKQRLLEQAGTTGLPGWWHEGSAPEFVQDQIIVDAIFGTGLSRPASGSALEIIRTINRSGCEVISIDMPSGLCSDEKYHNTGFESVKATFTLTFQCYKISMLLPDTGKYTGQIEVLDIGLDQDALEQTETRDYVLEDSDIHPLIAPRSEFSHKGNYGHALLVAGSSGMTGAAILTTGAALRSGTGLVTTHIPGNCKLPLQSNCPEAMTSVDPSDLVISHKPDVSRFDAVGIGPGIGTAEETAGVLKGIIQDRSRNLVIDADGLNILASNPTWLAFLPPHTILTPHPGEFERLAGKWSDGFERNQKLRELAAKTNSIIVLKGHFTAIADPFGMIFYSPTGNPGMAKGGSGDVLTGLITGLLAKGLQPLEAAIAGVFIHGRAGDLASEEIGMESMTAADLFLYIAEAFKGLGSR